jgi:hypothetical protein
VEGETGQGEALSGQSPELGTPEKLAAQIPPNPPRPSRELLATRTMPNTIGVSPAVFGLWPETFCRESGEPLSRVFICESQSARRRLEQPGRSRSPFRNESLRKGIRPVLKTGLIGKKGFENPM